jgi:hypothetical protein
VPQGRYYVLAGGSRILLRYGSKYLPTKQAEGANRHNFPWHRDCAERRQTGNIVDGGSIYHLEGKSMGTFNGAKLF